MLVEPKLHSSIFLTVGVIAFSSIIFVDSVPIGENIFSLPIFNKRYNTYDYNHPWNYLPNHQRSSYEREGIRWKNIWNASSKLSQLFQSFKKSRLKSSSEFIIGPEPKTKGESKTLKVVKHSSHCIVENGVQTVAPLLVDKLFDSFNRRRIGAISRSTNRRQFIKSTSIDIAKEASRCIVVGGVNWSLDSWWGPRNPVSNDVSR